MRGKTGDTACAVHCRFTVRVGPPFSRPFIPSSHVAHSKPLHSHLLHLTCLSHSQDLQPTKMLLLDFLSHLLTLVTAPSKPSKDLTPPHTPPPTSRKRHDSMNSAKMHSNNVHVVQEIPSAKEAGVLNPNTGFPEPLSPGSLSSYDTEGLANTDFEDLVHR